MRCGKARLWARGVVVRERPLRDSEHSVGAYVGPVTFVSGPKCYSWIRVAQTVGITQSLVMGRANQNGSLIVLRAAAHCDHEDRSIVINKIGPS